MLKSYIKMEGKVRAILLWIWLSLFAYYANAVEERCQVCNKIFKSLERHSRRCKTKLHTYPLKVDRNHDNDIDFNINIVGNQSSSIVNFNDQHTLENPEELVNEYDKQMQR